MYLLAKSFTYDGVELPLQYMLGTTDGVDTNKESYISRKTNKGEITPDRVTPHYYSSTYEDVLSFDVLIIKKDGSILNSTEIDDLILWLDKSDNYHLLTVTDYDGITYHSELEYFAMSKGFNEFGVGNLIYGLTFHFECNAPYAYSKEFSYPFVGGVPIEIDNTSHEQRPVYPIVELQSNVTGEITIKNLSFLPNEVQMLKVLQVQALKINNELGIIEDNMDVFDYSTDTNLVWICLTRGKNSLLVSGDVTGIIKCRYPKKRGI